MGERGIYRGFIGEYEEEEEGLLRVVGLDYRGTLPPSAFLIHLHCHDQRKISRLLKI